MSASGGIREQPIGTAAGAWVTPEVSYVDPHRRFCELCGRPIARRYWRTERGGEARIYCDPAHAALDATYPKSTNLADDHAGSVSEPR